MKTIERDYREEVCHATEDVVKTEVEQSLVVCEMRDMVCSILRDIEDCKKSQEEKESMLEKLFKFLGSEGTLVEKYKKLLDLGVLTKVKRVEIDMEDGDMNKKELSDTAFSEVMGSDLFV